MWLLFLAIGAWTASVSPFISVILQSHGVDVGVIGVLAALAAVLGALLTPAWGHLADVRAGRARAFQAAVGVAAVAAAVLFLPLPLRAFALVVATFAIYPSIFAALGDALAVGGLPRLRSQYGAVRACASLSFGLSTIVAGFVYDRTGYGAVAVVSLVWAATLAAVLRIVPDPTRRRENRAVLESGGDGALRRLGSVGRAFAVQPRLPAVLTAFTLAYAGMLGATTFVGIRIVDLGGRPSDVALTYGISSFAEIPGLVVAGWLVPRLGLRWLIALSIAGYAVCVASWGILSSPLAINVTRVVTGFCFGALMTGRVLVIARLLPRQLQATGQTMLQAVTFGLGTALGSVVGGFFYGAFGAMPFFLVAGGVAAGAGMSCVLVLRDGAPELAGDVPGSDPGA